jgi:ankyrin repeat protein
MELKPTTKNRLFNLEQHILIELKNLIESKVIDVNSYYAGCSLLQNACELGHYNIVKYLLESGADPNKKRNTYNTTCIMTATGFYFEYSDEIHNNVMDDYFLEHVIPQINQTIGKYYRLSSKYYNMRYDYDKYKYKTDYVQRVHISITKLLVDYGAELNNKDVFNHDILYYLNIPFAMSINGYIDLLKYLVDHGLIISIKYLYDIISNPRLFRRNAIIKFYIILKVVKYRSDRLIAKDIINKFLLRNVVLHPKSKYIQRLAMSF